jgi:xanthine dioxygenase
VTVVGHGYQGDDHYGLKGITMSAISHVDFHEQPLLPTQIAGGEARFVNWHFDGIIYGSHPSRITTFRCIKAPQGSESVTCRWDDGTGRHIKCRPGSTAFISGVELYNLLTPAEQDLFDNSYWAPAPHPFAWSGTKKLRNVGLGFAPGGKTVPLEDLPEWTPDKVYKYPFVWINPVTGQKGFQSFPEIVHKLFLKSSPESSETVVEDEEEIRVFLNDIYDRILTPERILVPKYEEGDLVFWNNWVWKPPASERVDQLTNGGAGRPTQRH